MTEQPPPVPPIDQTKAGVLWNKVRDHVVSDDNFAETPRPVNDDEDDEKNLKPPSLVYPPAVSNTHLTLPTKRIV